LNALSHVIIPLYVLVVTYAVFYLFPHMLEHVLRNVGMSLCMMMMMMMMIIVFSRVVDGNDVCLFDIQQRCSELLQLTAGNNH